MDMFEVGDDFAKQRIHGIIHGTSFRHFNLERPITQRPQSCKCRLSQFVWEMWTQQIRMKNLCEKSPTEFAYQWCVEHVAMYASKKGFPLRTQLILYPRFNCFIRDGRPPAEVLAWEGVDDHPTVQLQSYPEHLDQHVWNSMWQRVVFPCFQPPKFYSIELTFVNAENLAQWPDQVWSILLIFVHLVLAVQRAECCSLSARNVQ